MKQVLFLFALLFSLPAFSQSFAKLPVTNIKGENYDFTLRDVVAKDKPAEFDINTYFNPENVTILQYNFRIGYYFRDKYHISLGVDHMKYVVQPNQVVKIDGEINDPGNRFNGTYTNEDLKIVP
ncbi:hypothetical protein N9595_04100 [Bacteroidia bacterium]|nr:hypothetical protein [Bacteroidia bacterium]